MFGAGPEQRRVVEPDFGRMHAELRRSMRQQHRAGEKLFVDYAGPTLELADGARGQVFVAATGASSDTFTCVTAHQSMRSWLGSIGRTLRFLGGVPQMKSTTTRGH